MDHLVKKIDKNLNRLISSKDKVLVGVSGGPDSICLLYVLHEFSKTKHFSLAVAHINHMARGDESKSDAEFVAHISKKLELPFFLKEVDVHKEGIKLKRSFQEAARIIRFQFFEEILKEIAGTKIALGHSADDQVETILLNIIRGTGLKGLVGMPQIRGNIIRPFLQIYRKEIECYLEERKIPFRNDYSNNDTKYLRNKVRKELIPCLEVYNPAIRKNLNEMSQILEDDNFLLSQMTREIFNQNLCFKENKQGQIVWDIEKFMAYPVALKRRLIRETFFRISGEIQGITALHVEQTLNLFYTPKTGKILNLPKNVTVDCSYSSISFKQVFKSNKKTFLGQKMFATSILIPGITQLENGDIQVQTQIIEKVADFSSLNSKIEAFFDMEKTGSKLKFRFFREGDRFIPLGMSGSKKLKSFFNDKKVPQNIRSRIPILTNDKDDIIWVYGQRIAHFCRVTDKTKKMLYIQGNRPIN